MSVSEVFSFGNQDLQELRHQDLQFENLDSEIRLKSNFHLFRSLSELKNEAKGGYLEAEIDVPNNVHSVSIHLVPHNHSLTHPNLLFITPYAKQSRAKCQPLLPQHYKVQLIRKTSTEFEVSIQPPQYWIGNNVYCGPETYKNGKLKLGKKGLQLTVCKAGQKGSSSISVENMTRLHGYRGFDGELDKVRLAVILDNNPPIYSKVIFNKNKYLLKIKSIETPFICNQGDQIITLILENSVKITQDKSLKCVLHYGPWIENQTFRDFQVVSDNVVKFKISARGHETFNGNVLVSVAVDDESMGDISFFDQFSPEIFIQIEKHIDNARPRCYCDRRSTFQKTIVKKRKLPAEEVADYNQPKKIIHKDIETEFVESQGPTPVIHMNSLTVDVDNAVPYETSSDEDEIRTVHISALSITPVATGDSPGYAEPEMAWRHQEALHKDWDKWKRRDERIRHYQQSCIHQESLHKDWDKWKRRDERIRDYQQSRKSRLNSKKPTVDFNQQTKSWQSYAILGIPLILAIICHQLDMSGFWRFVICISSPCIFGVLSDRYDLAQTEEEARQASGFSNCSHAATDGSTVFTQTTYHLQEDEVEITRFKDRHLDVIDGLYVM